MNVAVHTRGGTTRRNSDHDSFAVAAAIGMVATVVFLSVNSAPRAEEVPVVSQHVVAADVRRADDSETRRVAKQLKELEYTSCAQTMAKALVEQTDPADLKSRVREIRKALDKIYDAGGPRPYQDAFSAFGNEKVAALFVTHPNEFVAIAKFTLGGEYAFEALENEKVAAQFAARPDVFVEIARRIESNATYAFEALENDRMAAMLAEEPDKAISTFERLAKALGNESSSAFLLLTNDKFAAVFVNNPETVIDLFETVLPGLPPGRDALEALKNDKVVDLLLNHPEVVSLARAAGAQIGYVLKSPTNNKVADLLLNHTSAVLTLVAAIGASAPYALEAIQNKGLWEAFLQDPQTLASSFGLIISATGSHAQEALGTLQNDRIAGMFLADAPKLAGAYGEIVEALGEDVGIALTSPSPENKSTATVHRDEAGRVTEVSIKVSGSAPSADRSTEVMRAGISWLASQNNLSGVFETLQTGTVSELFATHTDDVVSLVRASGEDAAFVLRSLDHDRIAGLFVQDAGSTSDALVHIALARRFARPRNFIGADEVLDYLRRAHPNSPAARY